jgi:hypothetical protein
MSLGSGSDGKARLLPRSAIKWELRYAEIWQRYTTALVDVIYDDDEAVAADPYVQGFHRELSLVMHNALPERYADFKTRAGLSRFASDTIHHAVVRHEVYGTTGVRAALDPRLNSTQIPSDGGPPGVDEWRSLLCVALATATARFTLLRGDFKYLLDGVDGAYAPGMKEAFDRLQADLGELEEEWTRSKKDKQFSYDYFRALPSDLRTGPGY